MFMLSTFFSVETSVNSQLKGHAGSSSEINQTAC